MNFYKITYKLVYTICILNLSFSLLFPHISSKDNQKEPIKQQFTSKATSDLLDLGPEMLIHFFKQPKYSKTSITCFLRHTFNHSYYAQKFLAVNFSHLKTFLSYASKSNQPRSYIESVLSLFRQKLKSTSYINAYAFIEFLDTMPSIIQPYFDEENEKKEKLDNIKNTIQDFLINNFEDLKENTEETLQNLSEKIYETTLIKPSDKEIDISVTKLQHTVMLFLETALSKLVWSPYDQKEIWESVKHIANKLEDLLLHNIILDTDSLDELFWTLIYRFCYFLEIAGSEISINCYQLINNELTTQKSLFWTLKERELFITPKLKYLKYHLMQAEARARACQAGIIADTV